MKFLNYTQTDKFFLKKYREKKQKNKRAEIYPARLCFIVDSFVYSNALASANASYPLLVPFSAVTT